MDTRKRYHGVSHKTTSVRNYLLIFKISPSNSYLDTVKRNKKFQGQRLKLNKKYGLV